MHGKFRITLEMEEMFFVSKFECDREALTEMLQVVCCSMCVATGNEMCVLKEDIFTRILIIEKVIGKL